MSRQQILERICASFDEGWSGTADDWWAANPDIGTINSIAPHFTQLSQAGVIRPAGQRPTRHGGLARVWIVA